MLNKVLEVSYGVYQALTFLPKLSLWEIGFYIGRGPLFSKSKAKIRLDDRLMPLRPPT